MSDDAGARSVATPQPEVDADTVASDAEFPSIPVLTGARPRRRVSRRHTLAVLVTAVAATLLAVFAGASQTSIRSSPTPLAVTPPLAQLHAVHNDAAAVLADLARTAAKAPTVDAQAIAYQTWTLNTEVDSAQVVAAQFIQPQEVTCAHSHTTVSVTARAGTPFAASGAVVIPASAHPVGQVIDQYTMDNPVPEPPDSAEKWAGYFEQTFGLDASAPAGEILMQVPSILDFRRLDAAQTSAMLTFLGTARSLDVAGAGRDRLGRRGVVFVGPSADGQYQTRATIDTRNGRILAIEVVYTGDERKGISSPSVTEYTAWR